MKHSHRKGYVATCFGWRTRGTIEIGASRVILNESVCLIGLNISSPAQWLRSRSFKLENSIYLHLHQGARVRGTSVEVAEQPLRFQRSLGIVYTSLEPAPRLYRLTATPAVDHMGHNPNTGLTGNSKGRRGVKTPTGARKRAKLTPPDSTSTGASSASASASASAEASQDSTLSSITTTVVVRETRGQSSVSFLDQRLDFRSFGRCTWEGWVGSGAVAGWLAKFALFEKASTPERAEREMVSSTELPLSFRGRNYLRDKCRAVKKMLHYFMRAYAEAGGRM
jgi:hypothetical protein